MNHHLDPSFFDASYEEWLARNLSEQEEKNMLDEQFFAHEEQQIALFGNLYLGGHL